jgi:ribosome biogenesis GTPase
MMQGVVTKSTGSWYTVLFKDGRHMECRLKGKFRLDGIKHTNPIAVGDKVTVEQEPDEGYRTDCKTYRPAQLHRP